MDDWTIERRGGRRIAFTMATRHEYGPALKARIAPLVTGVGPVEAAAGVAAGLARLEAKGGLPDLVVSLGSAGSRRCELGEVYQVATVAWRDIDASPLGFARGVVPFLDAPAAEALEMPLDGVPAATLSTGADIVTGYRYDAIAADMVDMETYAVVRACRRFEVPVMGLRGISDGLAPVEGMLDWTAMLPLLDERLAAAVDLLG